MKTLFKYPLLMALPALVLLIAVNGCDQNRDKTTLGGSKDTVTVQQNARHPDSVNASGGTQGNNNGSASSFKDSTGKGNADPTGRYKSSGAAKH